jgi:hypothetical protein
VETRPDWALERLIPVAYGHARNSDDISLVGVAVLTKDPVIITAVRESVVLYAEWPLISMEPIQEEFEWRVDQTVSERAKRFIEAFRKLFGEELPEPIPESAERYWHAYQNTKIWGRCVCLAVNDIVDPVQYYHWAIRRGADELAVHEFWSPERWTTDRYRRTPPSPPVGVRAVRAFRSSQTLSRAASPAAKP